MADDKKKPAARPLSVALLAEELAAALPGEMPAIELAPCADGGGLVTLRYGDPALHAARASADVEALRALPGHALAESAQTDVIPAPGAAPTGVVVACLLRRA